MLRQDFILKIIEQLFKAIAKLLKIDVEKETEAYLVSFEELLKTYFKLSSERLNELLESQEERDAFLFDEKIRTTQLLIFGQAGLGFLKIGEFEKAENCLKIIERIRAQHSHLYEFPNPEQLKLEELISRLRNQLKKPS